VEYSWNILKDLTKKDKLEIRQTNKLSTQMNYLKNGTRIEEKSEKEVLKHEAYSTHCNSAKWKKESTWN